MVKKEEMHGRNVLIMVCIILLTASCGYLKAEQKVENLSIFTISAVVSDSKDICNAFDVMIGGLRNIIDWQNGFDNILKNSIPNEIINKINKAYADGKLKWNLFNDALKTFLDACDKNKYPLSYNYLQIGITTIPLIIYEKCNKSLIDFAAALNAFIGKLGSSGAIKNDMDQLAKNLITSRNALYNAL